MTYQDVKALFLAIWRDHCETFPECWRDKPAYREYWGIMLDGLRRDGAITERNYMNWQPPVMPRKPKGGK